jgi:outer membrane lipoprotein-sorting protein
MDRRLLVFGLAFVVALSGRLFGADDARQIITEAQKRTDAKSQRYEGLLETTSEGGSKVQKQWTFERLGAHGQSKVVIAFKAPAEVKGVALLIVNHPDRASDQWMWTPNIERDRRVAVQDRSTRFFGTDFSFEDLEERDVDQFDYELLGEEKIDGAPCWKILSKAKSTKPSQYSKSIVWVRKEDYAFARIDSYVKEQVVRRLIYSQISNIQGIQTAKQLTMADLRRGSSTRLTLEKVEYNVPLSEDRFTIQSLRTR